MKTPNRRIGFRLISALNICFLLITIGGATAPFVPVWFLPFIQLIPAFFPLLLIAHLLFLFYFLRKSAKWVLPALLGIALCIWPLTKDIQWDKGEEKEISQDALRIVSFNVGTFDYDPVKIDEAASLIKELEPDVVTLQEFRNHKLEDNITALAYMSKALGFEYVEFVHLPVHIHGAATFSRFPIVGRDTLFMPPKEINSGILSTIQTPHGKVGVGNLHLSSYHVAQTLDQNDGLKEQSKAMYRNTSDVLKLQQEKVDLTLEKVQTYPHPMILTGDLNAPPHSRITKQFLDRYQDSFLAAGQGFGWSFPVLGPLGVRIDYQFSSEELEVLSHEVVSSEVSDHYPLLVQYQLNP